MSEIALLILAAGKSSRMRGEDKLMRKVGKTPQLRRIAMAACATSSQVYVTLPDAAHPRAGLLLGLDLRFVPVPEAHLGMGRSIAAGVASLLDPRIHGVMIVPADMPELTQSDLALLSKAFFLGTDQIIQAITRDGQPGHPVVFPKSLFEHLKALSGDEGAKAVLRSHRQLIRQVSLPKKHARTDLDTPEDWQEWLSLSHTN